MSRTWSPVSHLNAVLNSDALRIGYNACLPLLSAYQTDLAQSEPLYRAYRTIAEQESSALGPVQKQVIDHALRDFRLAGVGLDVERKERVDVRYSVEEKSRIIAKARQMEIAGAHLVGAVITSYLNGNLALPDQRTAVDDYIDELNALCAQIAKIGNNVNQIARVLNSGGHPQPVDATVLAHTERTLNAVRAAVADIDQAAYRAASRKAAA